MKIYLFIILFTITIVSIGFIYNSSLTKEQIDQLYNFGYITFDKDSYKNVPTGYGEMTWEGIHSIADFIKKKDSSCKTFIDIGSGSGKLLTMSVATNFFTKARGVEIVKERYDYSIEKRKELPFLFRSKIDIHYGDIFTKKDFFEPNSVIFVSNLLFPRELNIQLFDYLYKNAKKNTFVVVSVDDPLRRKEYIQSLKVPMTWLENSVCYIYHL